MLSLDAAWIDNVPYACLVETAADGEPVIRVCDAEQSLHLFWEELTRTRRDEMNAAVHCTGARWSRRCASCGGVVRWIEALTGGWWAHDIHPPDGHDAEVRSAQDAVIADLEERKAVGLERYGTLLYPFNGRDMLLDAYEEALDLAVYLRGCLDERDQALDDE